MTDATREDSTSKFGAVIANDPTAVFQPRQHLTSRTTCEIGSSFDAFKGAGEIAIVISNFCQKMENCLRESFANPFVHDPIDDRDAHRELQRSPRRQLPLTAHAKSAAAGCRTLE